MPINQRSYELNSVFLMDAMNDTQVRMIRMHGGLLEMLSKNPSATLEYIRSSDRGTTALARRFKRAAARWTKKDVPAAYLEGVNHANRKASRFRPFAKGTKTLSSPLLPQARLGTGIKIGGIPKGFKSWPNHLGMVKVFQTNADAIGSALRLQLLRGSRDVARQAAELAGKSLFREGAVFTRRKMSKKMLDKIASKGIGHITYANGRRVSLDSYTEMSARTLSGRAAVSGSLARYQEMGVDLVQVSAHGRTCDLCAPWEGRILSQSGDGKHPMVQTAIDAGLLHPNCAHDIFPHVPGVKQPEVRKHPMEKKIGRRKAFEAQSTQRHIERKTREWKRRLAGDRKIPAPPGVQSTAKAKVREWQAKMRTHLDANPFLPRKRYREQVQGVLGKKKLRRPRSGDVGSVIPKKAAPRFRGFFHDTFSANFSAKLTDQQIADFVMATFPGKSFTIVDVARKRKLFNRISGKKKLEMFTTPGKISPGKIKVKLPSEITKAPKVPKVSKAPKVSKPSSGLTPKVQAEIDLIDEVIRTGVFTQDFQKLRISFNKAIVRARRKGLTGSAKVRVEALQDAFKKYDRSIYEAGKKSEAAFAKSAKSGAPKVDQELARRKAQGLEEALSGVTDPEFIKWTKALVEEGLVEEAHVFGISSTRNIRELAFKSVKGKYAGTEAIQAQTGKKLKAAYEAFSDMKRRFPGLSDVQVRKFYITQYKKNYHGLANMNERWMSVNPFSHIEATYKRQSITDHGIFSTSEGQTSAIKGYRTTLRHEYGHLVDGQKFIQNKRPSAWFRDEVMRREGNWKVWAKKNLSVRSAANEKELFAELFSAYAHPDYKHGMLPSWIEQALKELVR